MNHANDLSRREREVLLLLSKGYSNQKISNTLNIQINTVKSHLKSIYRKLGVSSRLQAVVRERLPQR